MSLLNNALREAEERQRRPEVTGAYTGAVQEGRSGQRWLLIAVFLLVFGLAAVAAYWFTMSGFSSRQSPAPTTANVETGQVERGSEPAPGPQSTGPEMPVVAADTQMSEPTETVAERAPEPQAKKVQAAPTPEAVQTADASEPEPERKSEPEATPAPEPDPTPVVKSTPQSPEAIDRQTAKELERLIARGQMVEAERQLASLARSQPAPRSRFTVARALIVDGDIGRALSWLPEQETAADAPLRMLRARAQHANGNLDAAVATLESEVPPVAASPEYRVTLATLLQQQGKGEEAASHWAELIAWDDSRAPWWVGLAVALEGEGETRGAARAYEQAASLPGLPATLADFVQRRLQSLGAG